MRMGMNPFSSASVITTTGIILFWSIPTTFTFILTTGLTPGSAVCGHSNTSPTRLLAEPKPIRQGFAAPFQLAGFPEGERGPDKATVEGVRAVRAGPPLRMELAADEPRMVRQLHHLHQPPVGRGAHEPEARVGQDRAVGVVQLKPVAMALVDHRLAVQLPAQAPFLQHAGVEPQPH